VTKMVIDEDKKYILTNCKAARGTKHTCEECDDKFRGRKNMNIHKRGHTNPDPITCKRCGKTFFINRKAIDSDHNTQFMYLDLKIKNLKPEREEFF